MSSKDITIPLGEDEGVSGKLKHRDQINLGLKPWLIGFIIMFTFLISVITFLFITAGEVGIERREKEYQQSGILNMNSIKTICPLNDTISVEYCRYAENWKLLIQTLLVKSPSFCFGHYFITPIVEAGDLMILNSYKQAKLIKQLKSV